MKPREGLILWGDWRKRQRELSDLAGYFDYAKRLGVTEWIRLLVEKISTRNSSQMLLKYLNETVEAWISDFSDGDYLRKVQSRYASDIILSSVATGKLNTEMRTVVPLLKELRENFNNLTPIGIAFMPFKRKGDRRMHFYGLCYYYQLYVEGVFDQSIRLLFLLMSSLKGRSMLLPEINTMSLSKLLEEFQKLGLGDIFFGGWKRRVRNSIAHARFRYDSKLEKMHFVDIDPQSGQPDFHESFTLEEFGNLLAQLLDVYTIIQDTILLTRAGQLVLSPKVPGLGKFLLMPVIREGVSEGILEDPQSWL